MGMRKKRRGREWGGGKGREKGGKRMEGMKIRGKTKEAEKEAWEEKKEEGRRKKRKTRRKKEEEDGAEWGCGK